MLCCALALAQPPTPTLQTIDALRNLSWIDAATRVVVLEFTLFSPESNLVCAARMVCTFAPSGDAAPVIVKEAFRIDFYRGWAKRGRVVLDVLLLLVVLSFVAADIYSSFSKSHENGHADWYKCARRRESLMCR